MDPITLGVVSLAGSVISAGVGAVGAMQQSAATQASAKYQAQVARNNEIIAGQNATYAAQAGATAGQAQDFKNRATQGAILAAQSASGIDTESETSKEVRDSAARLGRLDTLNIIQQANLNKYGSQTQVTSFKAQAGLSDLQAKSASSAGGIGAFTSILGGASSFADKWLRFQNVGVPGFDSL